MLEDDSICFYVSVFVCECAQMYAGAHGGLKEVPDPLELTIKAVGNQTVWIPCLLQECQRNAERIY